MADSPAHKPPPPAALAAILGPSTTVLRKVDIVEQDLSPWMTFDKLGIVGGGVNVDSTRAERRVFDLDLDNSDGFVRHAPGQLWYDKIVRIWRGVSYIYQGDRYEWYTQVAECMIDEITSEHFPHIISIKGRDYTKKMLNSKFKVPTSFPAGTPIEELIRTLAINAGIDPNKIVLPITGHAIGSTVLYETGVTRWEACTRVASNFNYDLYFDAAGYLYMREFQDPSTSASSFKFKTGPDGGNLSAYKKSSRDSRIYNSIAVTGESKNKTPIYASAENHQIGSPTTIEEIGERVYQYVSSFIYTQEQAQATANKFLAVHSLEEYDLSLDSIVFPWLEGGDIVDFEDPDPDPGDPSRYLLSSFNVPLLLESMSSSAKRVVLVG